MTPPPRTWQRIIHELAAAGGALPAHVAIRRAGYSLATGTGSVLGSATLGCPALCEWRVGGKTWLGLLDGSGDLPDAAVTQLDIDGRGATITRDARHTASEGR